MKLTSYKQISTKKGDKGTSTNYSNDTFTKDDALFETLGTIDELSSLLGVVYHETTSHHESIQSIQRVLQDINALIATTNQDVFQKLPKVDQAKIDLIEQLEEKVMSEAKIEPRFVLPGSESSKESAYFDLARAVTRRCERRIVSFINIHQRNDLDDVLKYINRLSDLLFLIARTF